MQKKILRASRFDFSVFFGLAGAFAFVAIGIGLYSSISAFLNLPALLIVFGGTLCAAMVSFSLTDVLRAFSSIFKLIFGFSASNPDVGSAIMRASDIVHTNGLLSLQKNYMKSIPARSFWADGLNLMIDGMTGAECDQIMRSRMMSTYATQMNGVSLLNKMAEIAPAMGLIGTLIGLVQMLSTLSDPSAIGPAMAVAMLTTFYGALFAYLFCLPIASRLEQVAEANLAQNQLCLIGFKAVDSGQNPRKTQMELNALLPKENQLNYFEG
ncbi:MAG: MotA/TolQ/ExbB proton channel family protein [Alphaproteobacteria bacterium]|nr:MotA/TolQ/ExbB proton channel family protein [Alphaproteobacteria bacterium]